MKTIKTITYALLLITLVPLTFSCTSESENRGTTEDAYTNSKNIEFFTKITHERQRIEFLELTSSQRVDVWNEKLIPLINSIANEDEKKVVQEIRDFLNEGLVSSRLDDNFFIDELEPRFNILEKKYNWTNDAIFVSFATLYPVKKITPKSLKNTTNNFEFTIAAAGFELNCDCRWGGLGCAGEDCNSKSKCPQNTEDEMGCGFLFLQSCTGQCNIL